MAREARRKTAVPDELIWKLVGLGGFNIKLLFVISSYAAIIWMNAADWEQ